MAELRKPTYINKLGTGYDVWYEKPIAVNPKKFADKYGYPHWFAYDFNETQGVFGKLGADGKLDPATLNVYHYADMIDWGVEG